MRIAVLCGGPSGEHEVSINSGWQVLQHLAGHHRALPVRWEKNGAWRFAPEGAPGDWPDKAGLLSAWSAAPPLDAVRALQELKCRCDAAFVITHGPGGEDGRLQGWLELAGIPYTGSGVLGSALAMDKLRSKAVYAAEGIPAARHLALYDENEEAGWPGPVPIATVAQRLIAALGLPLVVKAPSQGSSVGLAMAKTAEELSEALTRLMPLEGRLLVEEFIAGRELTCGVLGPLLRREADHGGPAQSRQCNEPARALPPTEIRPKLAEYFDYRAKYEPGGSEEITPADLPPEIFAQVQALALRAHRALGAGGMSRTDMILRADGRLFVLETNTLPGMTATSLLPQQAAAAGMNFSELLEAVIARRIG